MVWPPQNTGLFEFKTPCCECSCPGVLLIPAKNSCLSITFADPSFDYWVLSVGKEDNNTFFADLITATSAITNNVHDCIAYCDPVNGDSGNGYTYTAVQTIGTNVIVSQSFLYSGDTNLVFMTWQVGLNLPAGSLVINWTASFVGTDISFILYDCKGILIKRNDISTTEGTGVETLTLPSAGEYIFAVFTNAGPPNSYSASFTLTGSGSISANNVVALYDDGSSTTAELPCT